MRVKTKVIAPAPVAAARATLTCLPQEVLEAIVNHLHGNDKNHLAMCCKATLPVLCMGHVSVRLGERKCKRPLHKATRCLMKQPGDVSHLEAFSFDYSFKNIALLSTRHLIELSLLSKLRKLTLVTVVLSLPALQPVATRLLELNLRDSRLQGSADGFLTRGWTALTTLSLEGARVETATMTAALKLPALEEINTNGFRHQGGVLQLDQLISGCPHVRGLSFQLDKSVMQGREGSGPRRSLQSLGRLTDLSMWTMLERLHAIMDLDLPAGLTRLKFEDSTNEVDYEVDFFWALHEAAQCIRRGAHLRKLICIHTEADLQPARWGASLDEQYRRLSGQLTSLHELEVSGEAGPLLAALGAVVSSAPCLTCVKLTISVADWPPHLEFSPICSASLKSFTVGVDMLLDEGPPLPPLVLTFLPGCTRLLKVLVRFGEYAPADGTAVRIRCHACSSACIVPLNFYACRGDNVRMHYYDGPFSDVGVQLLPGPPPRQGEQSYTVMYACHAAGPQQPLTWGHVVMPGFL